MAIEKCTQTKKRHSSESESLTKKHKSSSEKPKSSSEKPKKLKPSSEKHCPTCKKPFVVHTITMCRGNEVETTALCTNPNCNVD